MVDHTDVEAATVRRVIHDGQDGVIGAVDKGHEVLRRRLQALRPFTLFGDRTEQRHNDLGLGHLGLHIRGDDVLDILVAQFRLLAAGVDRHTPGAHAGAMLAVGHDRHQLHIPFKLVAHIVADRCAQRLNVGVDRGATKLEGVATHIQTQRLSNVVFGPEVGIGLQPFNGLGIRPGRFAISQNLTAVAHHPGIDGRPPVPGGVGEAPIHGVAIGILLQFGDLLAVGDQIFPCPGVAGQISARLFKERLVVIHGDDIEAGGEEVDFVIDRP